MAKSGIKRSDVHDSHMRTIILRLDYLGAEYKALDNACKKNLENIFSKRKETIVKEIKMTLPKEMLFSVSESVSMPINIIEKDRMMRYYDMKGTEDEVSLDISQYFLCMKVVCKNRYRGLDKYSRCFKEVIKLFKDNVPYFNPIRFGLRKQRIQDVNALNELDGIFEQFTFNDPNIPIGTFGDSLRRYEASVMEHAKNNIRVNTIRELSPNLNISQRDTWRTLLDIDVYYDSSTMQNIVDFNQLIGEANEFEFDVYKIFMKESYLRNAD